MPGDGFFTRIIPAPSLPRRIRAAAAQDIGRFMLDDTQQPGDHPAAAAESGRPFPDGDQALLNRILGRMPVAEDSAGMGK